jgi:hypothetical protein
MADSSDRSMSVRKQSHLETGSQKERVRKTLRLRNPQSHLRRHAPSLSTKDLLLDHTFYRFSTPPLVHNMEDQVSYTNPNHSRHTKSTNDKRKKLVNWT